MNNKLFSQFLRFPRLPQFPQLFLMITVVAALTFAGCRVKDKDKGDPPTLPPAETMQIDFSNFILTAKSAKGAEDNNWTTAAEIVSPWRTLAADIPVTAYKGAANQKANHVSGAKWEWSQSGTRLTGETTGSQVKWEMFVSDVKRLDGTSNTDATEGKWTLYEGQTALLQVDWKKTGTKIEPVKYTYTKDGNNKGAYIECGSMSGSYDFYYSVRYYNATLGKFSEARIEWNNASKAGRIRSADYLNGEWKEWDGQKMDK